MWLGLNILSILVLSFYSMMEMACVSFNKARLQYYFSKGFKRAIWLNFLLQNPSRLFGTTLIGVNVAMIVGSECSRQFYLAIGLNPDFAPLSQVIIVVIFGELSPMFAARRYPEHVAMLGIPLVYASAKIMAPFIWGIGAISSLVNKIVGGEEKSNNIFLNREELQKILEEQDEEHPSSLGKREDFNLIVSNIFNLRDKEAGQVMEPLSSIQMLPSNSTISQMKKILQNTTQRYVPIYHHDVTNIIGIATPRDLIRAPQNRRIRDYARPPWFITHSTKTLQIIKQFQNNKQWVAIVLDDKGEAIGTITLDDVLEEVFGKRKIIQETSESFQKNKKLLIDRTFSGETKVADFNLQFNASLDTENAETLAELMEKVLGHHPEVGESIYLEPFELTVKETSLLEVKSIKVKTKII